MRRFTIFADGLNEPINPGGIMCCGVVVFEGDVSGAEGTERPAPIIQSFAEVGRGAGSTNNIAEYKAVRWALRWAVKNAATDEVVIKTDSQLIVKQINREWACNKEHLRALRDECIEMLSRIPNARLINSAKEDCCL